MSNSRRGTNIIVMDIKKKIRQYRSNQGRSPKQQESNKVSINGCLIPSNDYLKTAN